MMVMWVSGTISGEEETEALNVTTC